MRKLITILLFTALAISCGTKRRTVSKKSEKRTEVRNEENKTAEKGLYPMPDDTGKFVRIPITSIEDYIATFREIAQFEMKAYGIPASITLAQGILESGYGQGELTRKTNNHFGIKCHNGWEGEFARHDDDARNECFRKYNHPMYSFRDHSIFLSSRSRYASLFKLRRDDYKGWARGLKAAGYATDKRYSQKLISFIERYELYQYDKEVLAAGYPARKQQSPYKEYVHVVTKGDTLYSLSKKYYISVEEIMELNNMTNSNLSVGQQLKIKTENVKK